jgi:hypothetical protein
MISKIFLKIRKISIENKKANILETLSVSPTNIKRNDKYVKLNVSTTSNRSNEEKKNNRIKDKIKNFVFEIASTKKNSSSNKVNDVPQFNKNKKNGYDFSDHPSFKSPKEEIKVCSLYDTSKFSTFTKSKNFSTMEREFKIGKLRKKEDESFLSTFEIRKNESTSTFHVKADEIRKISSQLRFCSPEELRKIDQK